MANLRIYKSIENEVYQVQFVQDKPALSEADKALIEKFGEPTINIGGTFLASTENAYTLPDTYIRIVSDLPYMQELDSKAAPFNTATLTKVNQFVTDSITKFTDAFTTLRANSDTWSGEQLNTI